MLPSLIKTTQRVNFSDQISNLSQKFISHCFLLLACWQYNKKNARLFMRNPFILKDQEWKDNRADISPAFTTLKTKLTYPVVDRMCKKLTKFIKCRIVNGDDIMDTKEVHNYDRLKCLKKKNFLLIFPHQKDYSQIHSRCYFQCCVRTGIKCYRRWKFWIFAFFS